MNTPNLSHLGRGFVSVRYNAGSGLGDTFNLRIGDDADSPDSRRRLFAAALELARIHTGYVVCKAATAKTFIDQTKGRGVLWLRRRSEPLPLP